MHFLPSVEKIRSSGQNLADPSFRRYS